MEHDYENESSDRSEFCVEHEWEDAMDEDGSTIGDNAHPLTFLFDTETTGLNIYEDHIIEIGAKVTGALVEF